MKHSLNFAEDYVKDWTIYDGIREFLQNALDQSKEKENNDMGIVYDKDNKKLFITNKTSVLEGKTLLLGCTTKSKNDENIGQFGEGYKVALLILTRNDKPVVIYNYGKKEVWNTRFVKSRSLKTKVLTVFIDKKFPWTKIPNNDLIVEISNITEEEYKEVINRSLFLQDIPSNKILNSSRGKILLDEKFKGKIFVNGLFISNQSTLKYGYDIKPNYLDIGRDRNLVNSFDIQRQTSYMWREQEKNDLLYENIKSNIGDVEYLINDFDWFRTTTDEDKYQSSINTISNNYYEQKVSEIDKDESEEVLFVSSQEEYETVALSYHDTKPIFVSTTEKKLLEKSDKYKDKKKNIKKKDLSNKDEYTIWKSKYGRYLPNDGLKELNKLIDQLMK